MDFWGKTKRKKTEETKALDVTLKTKETEETYNSIFDIPVGGPIVVEEETHYIPKLSENAKRIGGKIIEAVVDVAKKKITGK